MKLKRTWAVIDGRTRRAVSMSLTQAMAAQHFRALKAANPKGKYAVRQVCIPADHTQTGSFWDKTF